MFTAITTVGVAVFALPAMGLAQTESPPPRTFPQFVGTWALDESASTGKLTMAPAVARTLNIATTPVEITVTKLLLVPESTRNSPYWIGTETPPPEVYRFDGTETTVHDQRDPRRERRYSFRLVADSLALTIKETGQNSGGAFTLVTDAYSVAGDVLTLHRQLSSINASGHIATMQTPANNFRHTFVYRRAPAKPSN
jgi:hypothetical protein